MLALVGLASAVGYGYGVPIVARAYVAAPIAVQPAVYKYGLGTGLGYGGYGYGGYGYGGILKGAPTSVVSYSVSGPGKPGLYTTSFLGGRGYGKYF